MTEFPRLVRPARSLTPDLAGELASVLTGAMEVLERWELPVGVLSRLTRAQRHLSRVAERGSLRGSQAELVRTAKAAALATDFYQIATALTPERQDPIAEELANALAGALDVDSRDTTAYEYQSQYWVAVLLAQSGLRPGVPSVSTRRPDFMVTVNDLACAVETKRPQRISTAEDALSRAASQLLGTDAPAIIALDLSAAVEVDTFILPRSGVPGREEISRRLYAASEELGVFVHNYRRSLKFQHTIAMIAFARFWLWASIDPPISDAGIAFSITVFPRAYNGILIAYAERLQQMLLRGVEKVTGNPVSYTRIP